MTPPRCRTTQRTDGGMEIPFPIDSGAFRFEYTFRCFHWFTTKNTKDTKRIKRGKVVSTSPSLLLRELPVVLRALRVLTVAVSLLCFEYTFRCFHWFTMKSDTWLIEASSRPPSLPRLSRGGDRTSHTDKEVIQGGERPWQDARMQSMARRAEKRSTRRVRHGGRYEPLHSIFLPTKSKM